MRFLFCPSFPYFSYSAKGMKGDVILLTLALHSDCRGRETTGCTTLSERSLAIPSPPSLFTTYPFIFPALSASFIFLLYALSLSAFLYVPCPPSLHSVISLLPFYEYTLFYRLFPFICFLFPPFSAFSAAS